MLKSLKQMISKKMESSAIETPRGIVGELSSLERLRAFLEREDRHKSVPLSETSGKKTALDVDPETKGKCSLASLSLWIEEPWGAVRVDIPLEAADLVGKGLSKESVQAMIDGAHAKLKLSPAQQKGDWSDPSSKADDFDSSRWNLFTK
jgi:hypothetical protein